MRRTLALVACAVLVGETGAPAQNWSFDARHIGLGTPNGSSMLASQMIEEDYAYRVIVRRSV